MRPVPANAYTGMVSVDSSLADVRANYEALRGKLLDPSLRNRLLNAKTSRTVGVDVFGERSDEVYRLLVTDRKKLALTGIPDPVPEGSSEDEAAAPALPAPLLDVPVDVTDLKLSTRETQTRLNARLLATWRQAQAQLEEQGINTLYLALGMLRWYDSEASSEPIRAPLLLIPVRLDRTAAGDFRLVYDEADLGPNLSLLAKTKDDFGLDLPEPALNDEAFRPSDYASAVTEAIHKQPRWTVETDAICLGFFSFTKFVLYEDLDERRWPADGAPTAHRDLAASLGPGYAGDDSPFGEDTFLDNVRTPQESREVFNADSSQLLAIVEAQRGTSMVIEGPPGTGKSQTIANLIAESISAGKSVLFVSEKLAALDVVYRRLEEAKLADACLQLHSQRSNRRAFYDEIERVWNLRGRLEPATESLERLREVRDALNSTVEALNAPVEGRGLSPRTMIGELATLPDITAEDLSARHDFGDMRRWTWTDVVRRTSVVLNLQRKVSEIGVPAQHPFWGCALSSIDNTLRLEIGEAVRRSIEILAEARVEAKALADALHVPEPLNVKDVAILQACVEIAVSAPELDGVAVKGETWQRDETRVRALIADLRRAQALHKARDAQILPHVWDADLHAIRAAFEAVAHKWSRFFSGDFRAASRALRAYLTPTAPTEPVALRDLVRDVVEAQGLSGRIRDGESLGRTLFGVQWQGEASDPDRLERLLEWTLALYRAVEGGRVPEGLLDFFAGAHASADLQRRARAVADRAQAALAAIERIEALLLYGGESARDEEPLTLIAARLSRWSAELSRLTEWVEYVGLREEAVADGLAQTVALSDHWPLAAERLEASYRRGWLEGALAEALDARPVLRRFDRTRYESLIDEFRRLDEASLAYHRAQVAHAHLQSVAGVGSEFGNAAELRRQCQLRKGHRPIRWAMERMPELIQRIKPVFLMSPLSVPSFLPPRKDLFDLVIFDEASQVKPEDALSAIARGRQVVVVGDSKQMPPTSFFEKLSQAEEEGSEGEGDGAVGKLESVLALFASAVSSSSRRRWLRWHYRSLHPALIQPSNHLFYEDKLVVPPSPVYATAETASGMGVVLRYDPSTLYERSGSRKNPLQARAVAQAVQNHLRARPQETLLVVAFSKAQQEAIEDELERLRREDATTFDGFAALHPHEPLTVKNLETVQGDERDVTFVSVGYGRDTDGKLTMNFGPINAEGGERRLNVLMTRARKRCEVFTSLRAGDLTLGESPKFGVVALKRFLEYAETGRLDLAAPTGREADSPFELAVARAIEAHGYAVDLQVGSLGFRIDLAVRHPERPGYYVLGIECDGASYHSARSARDRDKIRQAILENRGWRLHRVWSTDWWRDPVAETRRLLSALIAAVESFGLDEREKAAAPAASGPEPPTLQVYQDESPTTRPAGVPYRAWEASIDLSPYDLLTVPPDALARTIAAIVDQEGPIHRELLTQRLREATGIGRAGSKIQAAIGAGIDAASRSGAVEERGEFLYRPGNAPLSPRDRSALKGEERKAEWVAQEEIAAAIEVVVGRSYGIARDDLPRGVRDVLGFSSASSRMSERVLATADLLVTQGRLAVFDGLFRLAEEA